MTNTTCRAAEELVTLAQLQRREYEHRIMHERAVKRLLETPWDEPQDEQDVDDEHALYLLWATAWEALAAVGGA